MICPVIQTFVKRDIEMLKNIYDKVDVKLYENKGFFSEIKIILSSFLFTLRSIKNYDLVAIWFPGYHSFFPLLFAKLFKKQSVIFIGGTECHNIPEINHGNYRKPIYAWFTRRSLALADHLLPVDKSLVSSQLDYIDVKFKEQGLVHFNKNIEHKINVLNCGFEKSKDCSLARIPNSFLTVSTYLTGPSAIRKGVDLFVQLAEQFPQYKFTLIGKNYSGPKLENLEIISFIPYQELTNQYCKHQFYIQFSIAEGQPNALAESMLYGCIPIGSNVFGIPSLIGTNGFLLYKKSINSAIQLIHKVTSFSTQELSKLSQKAIQSISINYTPEKRMESFIKIIQKI